MHAPKQQRGRERQEALIRAGLQLTERHDWNDVKVSDIAAAIGCSTGTFYTRFHSKEAYFEVLLSLVTADMQATGDAFFGAAEREVESPAELVGRWVELALHSFATHRGLYATAIIELRRKKPEEAAQSALLRFRDRSRMQWLAAMARWPQWRGDLARQHVLFAHQMLQGVLINAVLSDPGPLHLRDPQLCVELSAALCAYLGLAQPAAPAMGVGTAKPQAFE